MAECSGIIGRSAQFYVETSPGSGSYYQLLGKTTGGHSIATTLANFTSDDSAGWVTERPVERQVTGTATVNVLPSDPAYNLIVNNQLALIGCIYFRKIVGDGTKKEGQCNFTDITWSESTNDPLTVAFSWQSTGPVTRTAA